MDDKHETILMKWIINFNSRINNKWHICQTYYIWVKVCNSNKKLTCYVISLRIFLPHCARCEIPMHGYSNKIGYKELQFQFPQHVINETLDIVCPHSKYL